MPKFLTRIVRSRLLRRWLCGHQYPLRWKTEQELGDNLDKVAQSIALKPELAFLAKTPNTERPCLKCGWCKIKT